LPGRKFLPHSAHLTHAGRCFLMTVTIICRDGLRKRLQVLTDRDGFYMIGAAKGAPMSPEQREQRLADLEAAITDRQHAEEMIWRAVDAAEAQRFLDAIEEQEAEDAAWDDLCERMGW